MNDYDGFFHIFQEITITAAEELRLTKLCENTLKMSTAWKTCSGKFDIVKEIEKTFDSCVLDIKVLWITCIIRYALH